MKQKWMAVALAVTPLAAPAIGQIAPVPAASDPSDRLAANLVLLAQNPNDVRALKDAGLSAVEVGDGNAALSFLAKAEALSPRDGRIKMGLGSALLLLEKPAEAVKLYDEAVTLGVAETEVARERGLAHDLRGDPRRAQRDYALALRRGPDDEVTRRYALSLGISGDREGALDMLEPLLRRQDLAAWRARAFILAMTGDVSGAEALAQRIMPGGAGASMSPFLQRLATLDPAHRALAVNMGIMPSAGTLFASASPLSPVPTTGGAGSALIPAGDPFGPRADDAPTRKPEPVSKEPRRRPGRETVTFTPAAQAASNGSSPSVTHALAERVGKRIGPVDPQRLPPEIRPGGTTPARPVAVLANTTQLPPPAALSAQRPGSDPSGSLPSPPAVTVPPAFISPAPGAQPPRPGFSIDNLSEKQAVSSAASAVATPLGGAPQAALPAMAPAASAPVSLASIVATLEREPESAAVELPDAAALRSARLAAQRKAAATAKADAEARAAKAKKDAEALAAKKNPARVWVQVATGANDSGLPLTWKRLREKAPAAFKGLSASAASYRSTNRLLVGPFKSAAEAKRTVGALSKAGISTFVFNSEAGQEIAKVAAK